jgi:hypothetical protein
MLALGASAPVKRPASACNVQVITPFSNQTVSSFSIYMALRSESDESDDLSDVVQRQFPRPSSIIDLSCLNLVYLCVVT